MTRFLVCIAPITTPSLSDRNYVCKLQRTVSMRSLNFLVLGVAGMALGHGDHDVHSQRPIVDENANWMTKHMAGETPLNWHFLQLKAY